MLPRVRYSAIFAGLLAALSVVAWLVFLPIQFGGATAYVVINGNSMLPTYERGDLVILRREAVYAVGDIVTYFNTDINQHVIHRIVEMRDGVFVLKGDNNEWLDRETPVASRIVGKAWLHFPGMGNWLIWFQTPLGLSVLSAVIFLILASMYVFNDPERRKRMRKFLSGMRSVPVSIQFSPQISSGATTMPSLGRQLEALIFAVVVLFILSAMLAYVAFTNEETLSRQVDTEYVHIGVFSYFATPQPGVYDAGSPSTGDPIFLRSTCEVTARYDYRLTGMGLSDVKGTISLRAEVSDVNGWRRTFVLAPETAFEGASAVVQAALNPCQIINEMRAAEELTGVRRSNYQLALVPEVKVQATLPGNLPLGTIIEPALNFVLDDSQMYVLRDPNRTDPLSPFQPETRVTVSSIPNTIQLPGGLMLQVGIARVIALMGLGTALILAIFLFFQVSAQLKRDPILSIFLRYGGLIVTVNQANFELRSREILISSIEDAIKLAERNTTVVLHLPRADRHDFLVEGNGAVYRYSVPRAQKVLEVKL
jgi:signal peptidase I